MIVTKKALPRPARFCAKWARPGASLAGRDAAVHDGAGRYACGPMRKRLGFLYVPMGAHRPMWTSAPAPTWVSFHPTLTPLAKVREYCTVIQGTELKNAYHGTHATSNAAFLSAATSKWTESSDYYLGTTVDQVAASSWARKLGCRRSNCRWICCRLWDSATTVMACVYQNNLSWSSPTTPLPLGSSSAHRCLNVCSVMVEAPRNAWRKMRANASLLDWMKQDYFATATQARPQRPNQS